MARRRIPAQSVSGKTPEETERLHDLFYLGELERQADMFGRSSADAMAAVDVDAQDVWRHLQSALFAGIVVNRLVRGGSPPDTKRRANRLRQLVCLTGEDGGKSAILTMYNIRHSLEHIDERIEVALRSPDALSLSDCYLSDGLLMVSPEGAVPKKDSTGLRAFNPDTGLFHFDRDILSMFLLDLHMITLLHNARDAQWDLCKEVEGRQLFGGGALVSADWTGDDGTKRRAWEEESARWRAKMKSPAPLDGHIRLWLSPEDER